MNNVVMRRIVLTGEYRPLVEHSLVATVDVSAPPGNAGPVFFLGDDGADVPWIAGEWHLLVRVDLSTVKVRGVPGDVLTLVGGTW
jgi:hypothetical protein